MTRRVVLLLLVFNSLVAAVLAEEGALASPSNLTERAVYADALEVGWQSDARAVSHTVSFCSVTSTPAAFRSEVALDFSHVSNSAGIYRDIVPLDNEAVSFQNILAPPRTNGVVMLGNTQRLGILAWQPNCRGTNLTVLISLWKHPNEKYRRKIEMLQVYGAETNVLSVLTAPYERTTFAIEIREAKKEEWVVLRPTAKGRVYVDQLEVVSEYVSATVKTNAVRELEVGGVTHAMATGLWPGAWLWSVRAHSKGGYSSPAAFRETTLPQDAPRFEPPGCVLLIK